MAMRTIGVTLAMMIAAQSASAADRRVVSAGETLAKRHCGGCHAVGPGQRSRLPRAPSFRQIAARYSVWNLQEALAEGIVVGHHAMPKFVFTPYEIQALLSYMDAFTPKKGRAGQRP